MLTFRPAVHLRPRPNKLGTTSTGKNESFMKDLYYLNLDPKARILLIISTRRSLPERAHRAVFRTILTWRCNSQV